MGHLLHPPLLPRMRRCLLGEDYSVYSARMSHSFFVLDHAYALIVMLVFLVQSHACLPIRIDQPHCFSDSPTYASGGGFGFAHHYDPDFLLLLLIEVIQVMRVFQTIYQFLAKSNSPSNIFPIKAHNLWD